MNPLTDGFNRNLFLRYVDFLFRPADARVYALFRITFSLAVFFNFIDLWGYRAELFSESGMIDQAFVTRLCEGQPYYSLFHHFDSLESVTVIFVVAGIAIFFMAIGLLTRLSVLVVYIFQLSYINAIFPVLSGWDTLLTLYTFLLLISPIGEVWSVDGWIKRKLFGKSVAGSAPAYGLYVMRVQLCLIYWSTAALKLQDPYWQNGEFFSYFMLSIYSRFPDPFFTHYTILSKLLTYGTLAIEVLVPFLLFREKLKWLGFLLGYSLHLGIMVSSNLFLFSFAMFPLYIPFLKSADEILWILKRNTSSKTVDK